MIDWKLLLTNIAKMLYFPIYLFGLLALNIFRLLLALTYFIVLDPLPAKSILRRMFKGEDRL